MGSPYTTVASTRDRHSQPGGSRQHHTQFTCIMNVHATTTLMFAGFQLAQLAQQIQWLNRPPRHELEPLPVAAALELEVDRARLAIQLAEPFVTLVEASQ